MWWVDHWLSHEGYGAWVRVSTLVAAGFESVEN